MDQPDESQLRQTGNSASLGNHYLFSQQKKQKLKNSFVPTKAFNNQECMKLIDTLECNCPRRKNYSNCFLACPYVITALNGEADLNKACDYLRHCRSYTDNKNKVEFQAFVVEKFKASLVGSVDQKNGNVKNQHKYELPYGDEVCRQVFALCYGFTNFDLDKCSTLHKQSSDGSIVYHKNHMPWDDGYIPDFNHYEAEYIFRSNCNDAGKVKILFLFMKL